MTVQTIISGSTDDPPNNTSYAPIQASYHNWNSQQFVNEVVSAAGVFKKLFVQITNSPGTGKSRTFTLMKNGAATGLTVTISGNSQVAASDTTNTVSVSPGDYVSLRQTISGSVLTSCVAEWSIQFDSTTDNEVMILGCSTNDVGLSGSAEYNCPMTGQNWTTDNQDPRQYCPISGTIKSMYIKLEVSPGSGKSRTFNLLKNGSSTGLTVTLSDSETEASVASDVSISPGDMLIMSSTESASPTNSQVGWGFKFETTDDQAPIFGSSSSSPSDSVDRFYQITNAGTTIESNYDDVMSLGQFIDLKDFYIYTQAAPVSGSYTWTVVKDGVDTDLEIVQTGTDQTAQNTSDVVRLSDGCDLAIRVTPSGSPSSLGAVRWGFVTKEAPEPQLYTKDLSDSITLTPGLDKDIDLTKSESLSLTDTAPKTLNVDRTTARTFLRPVGDKYKFGWTPSSGSDYYPMVDEEYHDDDTTYLHTQTDDAYMRFYMTPDQIPSDAIITNVEVTVWAKKNAGNPLLTFLVFGSDGNGVGTTGITLQDYYTFKTRNYPLGFNDNPWTVDQVNGMELHVQRDSDGYADEIRVTQAYVVIEYTTNRMNLEDLPVKRHLMRPIPDSFSMSDGDTKHIYKLIENTLNLSPNATRQWTLARSYNETANLTDSASKRPYKTFTDSFTLSDASVKKSVNKKAIESLELADSFTRQWILSRVKDDATTLISAPAKKTSKTRSETLNVSDSLLRLLNRTLSEDLQMQDIIKKNSSVTKTEDLNLTDGDIAHINKTIVNILSVTGAITKQDSKTLTELIELLDSKILHPKKTPQETMGLSDTMDRSADFSRELTEGLSLTEILRKALSVTRSETISLTDVKLVALAKIMQETAHISDSATKKAIMALVEQLDLTDTLIKHPKKAFSESLELTDEILTNFGKILVISEELFLEDSISRQINKRITEDLELSDGDIRDIQRTMTEALNLTENQTSRIIKTFQESVGLTDSKLLSITKNIAEELDLSDEAVKSLNKLALDYLTIKDINQFTLLNNFSSLTNKSGSGLTLTGECKEGSNAIRFTPNNGQYGIIFTATDSYDVSSWANADNSMPAQAGISFWIYSSDVSETGNINQVEFMTENNNFGYVWTGIASGRGKLHTGWNRIFLPFGEGSCEDQGSIDWENLDWFQLYNDKEAYSTPSAHMIVDGLAIESRSPQAHLEKTALEDLDLTDSRVMKIDKEMLESVELVDSKIKQIAKFFLDNVDLSDGDIKQFVRQFSENITVVDSKNFHSVKEFTETLGIEDLDSYVAMIVFDVDPPSLVLVKTTKPQARVGTKGLPLVRIRKEEPEMKSTTMLVTEIKDTTLEEIEKMHATADSTNTSAEAQNPNKTSAEEKSLLK